MADVCTMVHTSNNEMHTRLVRIEMHTHLAASDGNFVTKTMHNFLRIFCSFRFQSNFVVHALFHSYWHIWLDARMGYD